MAERKEGFTPINEVRAFLSGLKDTKNSKVHLKVEQKDGYNYLCVYLDNKYTEGESAVANDINGFRKWYQLKMNKVGE